MTCDPGVGPVWPGVWNSPQGQLAAQCWVTQGPQSGTRVKGVVGTELGAVLRAQLELVWSCLCVELRSGIHGAHFGGKRGFVGFFVGVRWDVSSPGLSPMEGPEGGVQSSLCPTYTK